MKKTNEVQEWQHIAAYESGKADFATTILNLFNNQLDTELKKWLEIQKSSAKESIAEAESKR